MKALTPLIDGCLPADLVTALLRRDLSIEAGSDADEALWKGKAAKDRLRLKRSARDVTFSRLARRLRRPA